MALKDKNEDTIVSPESGDDEDSGILAILRESSVDNVSFRGLELDGGRRCYFLTLLSDATFLIGTGLKIYLAFILLELARSNRDVADDLSVLTTPFSHVAVSRFMMAYFGSALAFTLAGLIDVLNHGGLISYIMILAGACGMSSAAMTEKHDIVALHLTVAAVHVFCLQGLMLFSKRELLEGPKPLFKLADLFFIAGTLIDVALIWLYQSDSVALIYLSYAFLGAASFWGIAGLLYLFTTFYLQMQEQKNNTSSDASSKPNSKEDFVMERMEMQ